MTDTKDHNADQPTTDAAAPGAVTPASSPDTAPQSGAPGEAQSAAAPDAAPLHDLAEDRADAEPVDWDLQMVGNIPVTLSVEVGRHAISIHNLLQLSQGSIVELDRNSGEPLDVLVNGCLVAHGEVVVVNERFGVRLTDVVSPGERFRKLN